jgi:hypothetical protein
MLIEFFSKHNKLLIVMVILALFGIWNIVGDLASIVIQLQHCDVFSSNEMTSTVSIVCYIFGQG